MLVSCISTVSELALALLQNGILFILKTNNAVDVLHDIIDRTSKILHTCDSVKIYQVG